MPWLAFQGHPHALDDEKIQGSTKKRQDIHLLETVDKASATGIKFNPQKCHIKK